jgi:hypothetical protein
MVEHLLAEKLPKVKKCLGIAMTPQSHAAIFTESSKYRIIVELAVINNAYVARWIEHGLVASR